MNWKKISVSALFILSIGLNIFFLTGCNTFKPVDIPGKPMSCNRMYTLLSFANSNKSFFGKDKSVSVIAMTLVAQAYNECKDAEKEQEKERLKKCVCEED